MRKRVPGILACVLLLAFSCQQSDPAITGVVKTKLAADSEVSAFEIEVDTRDGVVTLTGNIDDPGAKERALRIARETKGVKRVVDMISVRREGGTGDAPASGRTLGETIDDAAITAEVKARFLADPDVKGLKIDVDTREGVVYLTGTVQTREEKDRAVELARRTKNVTDVQDNLEIQND